MMINDPDIEIKAPISLNFIWLVRGSPILMLTWFYLAITIFLSLKIRMMLKVR